MRTLAVLPVKSFGAAKSRLSAMLEGRSRQALAQAMFGDTLAALCAVPGMDAIAVVSSDGAAREVAEAQGVAVLPDEAQAGHNPAAQIGLRHALEAGYERALLVPGDAPLLDPGEVRALLERCAEAATAVAVIPDRHGTGTNALLIAPPEAFEPSFGPGSSARHLDQAAAAGLAHSLEVVPSLALDVDTPEDLDALAAVLDARQGAAPLTRAALRELAAAAAA